MRSILHTNDDRGVYSSATSARGAGRRFHPAIGQPNRLTLHSDYMATAAIFLISMSSSGAGGY